MRRLDEGKTAWRGAMVDRARNVCKVDCALGEQTASVDVSMALALRIYSANQTRAETDRRLPQVVTGPLAGVARERDGGKKGQSGEDWC